MSATPRTLLRRVCTGAAAVTSAVLIATLGTAFAPSAGAAETGQVTAGRHDSVATAAPTVRQVRTSRVARAKAIALNQVGDPYRYGAAGPNAFDCSGLVLFSTRAAGFKGVPRSSGAQAAFMRPVAKRKMRPGDFMFFANGGGVYHAAIFLGWTKGGARMVHSPGSGRKVTVARPWTSGWFGRTLR